MIDSVLRPRKSILISPTLDQLAFVLHHVQLGVLRDRDRGEQFEVVLPG